MVEIKEAEGEDNLPGDNHHGGNLHGGETGGIQWTDGAGMHKSIDLQELGNIVW